MSFTSLGFDVAAAYEPITPLTQVRVIAATGQTENFGWFHIDMAQAGIISSLHGRTVPGGTLGHVIGTQGNFVRVQTQGFGALWFMSQYVRTN